MYQVLAGQELCLVANCIISPEPDTQMELCTVFKNTEQTSQGGGWVEKGNSRQRGQQVQISRSINKY